jgi:hypothetical protein
MLYLGGVKSEAGDSSNEIFLFNKNSSGISNAAQLPKEVFFHCGTYLPKMNSLVVCGGYVGQPRIKFAASRMNLVN